MAGALTDTVLMELLLSLPFLKKADAFSLAIVALAQLVTNPVVEVVCLASGWRPSLPLLSSAWACMAVVELAACVVEGAIYRHTDVSGHPWAMSCTLNAFSFGVGVLQAMVA